MGAFAWHCWDSAAAVARALLVVGQPFQGQGNGGHDSIPGGAPPTRAHAHTHTKGPHRAGRTCGEPWRNKESSPHSMPITAGAGRFHVRLARAEVEGARRHEEHGPAPDAPRAADVGMDELLLGVGPLAGENARLVDRRERGVIGDEDAHDAGPDALDDEEDLDERGHLELGGEEAVVGVDHDRSAQVGLGGPRGRWQRRVCGRGGVRWSGCRLLVRGGA